MKKLPIIRHIRWLYLSWQVHRHYEMWGSIGFLPVNADRDYEMLDAIWRGDQ